MEKIHRMEQVVETWEGGRSYRPPARSLYSMHFRSAVTTVVVHTAIISILLLSSSLPPPPSSQHRHSKSSYFIIIIAQLLLKHVIISTPPPSPIIIECEGGKDGEVVQFESVKCLEIHQECCAWFSQVVRFQKNKPQYSFLCLVKRQPPP